MVSSEQIQFNPRSLEDMVALMKIYGDSKTMFPGVNEHGEDIYVSIFKDKIVVVTSQSNGWQRKNIYYRNGDREETFEGRE